MPKYLFRGPALLFVALLALASIAPAFGAQTFIESKRSHAAAGSFGCTVNAASVATPSVIGCTAAHNLQDGDQVQIVSVGGTTTVNGLAYVKVTGQSSTTFAIYSDAALSTGITGTGSYTSGGSVSMAYDISGLSGDFTLRVRVESLTAAKKVLLAVQDSADGFVSDVKTLMVVNLTGSSGASGPYVEYTIRAYQVPSLRLGVTNARLRLNVQSIDGSAAAAVSFVLEQ